MASFAMLLFAMVAVMVLMANFKLNYAANTTSEGYDIFASETVEKNGIAQAVKESILAIGETSIQASANSLQTEIQNRLSSMNFGQGVSVSIDSGTPVPSVPANPFYPFGTPANGSQPAYFSTSAYTRAVSGMGGLFTSLTTLGPAVDLGRLTVAFDRTSSASPTDNRTYVVNADLFSVPLTNVDVVAYGLPVTGTIPSAAPTVPAGFFSSSDVSRLVVSSNNPANDPTAYPDLYASSTVEKLPYQYRNAVSFSWNAYEYLWYPRGDAAPPSSSYPGALLSAASTASTIYNFSSPPSQSIPGVTVNGNALTVDCSAFVGSVLAIVDPSGIGSVTITNSSSSSGTPFIVLVRNTAGTQTPVTFSGSNNRPAIYYLENANVQFTGSPQIQGALFLDPTTSASGTVTWFGHFSFYGPAGFPSGLNLTMADSASVKAALAPLSPYVLLVSTTATR